MPRNPSPAGTPPSIAPSPDRDRSWFSVLKTLILIAALGYVGWKLFRAIDDVRRGSLLLQIRGGWLVVSAAIVLGTYTLLISSWLYIVRRLAGRSIPFLTGARIWFISNLGTLLPGRVWGIIQMGAMSVEQGINPVAAGGASVINAAVNIACGIAVGAVTGAEIYAVHLGDFAWLAWVAAVGAVLGIVLLPVLLPILFRALGRRGREVPTHVPVDTVIVSVGANVLSWVLYGAAFLALSKGILGDTPGTFVQHIAAFATSYVLGYLAIIVPLGIGVREKFLEEILKTAQMVTAPQAQALTVVSRLWLLIIQVLPALIFLAYRRPRDETTSPR